MQSQLVAPTTTAPLATKTKVSKMAEKLVSNWHMAKCTTGLMFFELPFSRGGKARVCKTGNIAPWAPDGLVDPIDNLLLNVRNWLFG